MTCESDFSDYDNEEDDAGDENPFVGPVLIEWEDGDDDLAEDTDLETSATQHLLTFPTLVCENHNCKDNQLVYHDRKTERKLKYERNWWSDTFLASYVTLLIHSTGEHAHQPHISVIFRWHETHAWNFVVTEDTRKVIIIQLVASHFTITSVDVVNKSATIFNGLKQGRNRYEGESEDKADNTRYDTIKELVEQCGGKIGTWEDYKNSVAAGSYLEQGDNCSCGPIAIMAFYFEYTGKHLFPMQDGYCNEYRILLVERYYRMFYKLAETDGLYRTMRQTRERYQVDPTSRYSSFYNRTDDRGRITFPYKVIQNNNSNKEIIYVSQSQETDKERTKPKVNQVMGWYGMEQKLHLAKEVVKGATKAKQGQRHQENQKSQRGERIPTRSGKAQAPKERATDSIMETAKKPYNTKPGKRQQTGRSYERGNMVQRKQKLSNIANPYLNLSTRKIDDAKVDVALVTPEREKTDSKRTCYCDIYCADCNQGDTKACPRHDGIDCKGDCGRYFHYNCLGVTGEEIEDKTNWKCIRCPKRAKPDACWKRLKQTGEDLQERFRRLGIVPSTLNMKAHSEDARRRACIDYVKRLKETVGEGREKLVQAVLDNSPKAYPTIKPMNKEAKEKMAIHGRWFELQMLELEMKSCRCCGLTKPHYANLWENRAPQDNFRRYHLVEDWHKAYHCQCKEYCRGDQFYLSDRPTQLKAYSSNHRRKIENLPMVIICNNCAAEYNSPTDQSMEVARRLSRRNGFGPVPRAVKGTTTYELRQLMLSFTSAEEAGIRMVCPCISLIRLRYGNLGTKGNTTCVAQESKLQQVLPNIPEECKTLVIERSRQRLGVTIEMQSWHFNKMKMLRGLQMLVDTRAAPWNEVTICSERLSRWPEEGNLAGMSIKIQEEEEEEEQGESKERSNKETERVEDEGDKGPSPLQNALEPDETYDGTDQKSIRRNNIANAKEAIREFENTCKAWEEGGIKVRYKGNKAYVESGEILRTKEFVNMMKLKWSWARAFPTVFLPEYNKQRGNGIYTEIKQVAAKTKKQWTGQDGPSG